MHIDLLSGQHPQATNFLSNARVHNPSQPHNLVHMQHTPGYEEYEIPPRHQRNTVTINRGNSRHTNQPRHFMNPRGIVGQNPRHRHQMRTTATHQGNHLANFWRKKRIFFSLVFYLSWDTLCCFLQWSAVNVMIFFTNLKYQRLYDICFTARLFSCSVLFAEAYLEPSLISKMEFL